MRGFTGGLVVALLTSLCACSGEAESLDDSSAPVDATEADIAFPQEPDVAVETTDVAVETTDGVPSSEADDAGHVDAAVSVAVPLEYRTCPDDVRLGGFLVTLAEDYTGASGQVLDGVVPANVPELVQTEGPCRLMQARSLHCDPGCVPGEACSDAGDCIPYPERGSVGEVTILGLFEALSMEAKWGNTYTNQGSMVHPGYLAGAEIALTAEGGDFEPFELGGFGVEALEQSDGSEILIEAGAPIALLWDAPTVDGPVNVHIELNLNNHGSTSAWIACDVEDTGAFTLSSSLLDALYAIGVSGFPSMMMSRRSSDAVMIAQGCVEFMVHSDREVSVAISGVTSCTQDQQCPPGQSCGADLACH
jgi:hypothetical protein